jgi:hypothetical protein
MDISTTPDSLSSFELIGVQKVFRGGFHIGLVGSASVTAKISSNEKKFGTYENHYATTCDTREYGQKEKGGGRIRPAQSAKRGRLETCD